MNRMYDPLFLPPFPTITPGAIAPALDDALNEHRAVVAEITERQPSRFEDIWLPLERAEASLHAFWSAVSHLHAVASTPELRAAYAAAEERLVENDLAVSQNRELYDVLMALLKCPRFVAEPAENRVAVEHRVRDFALSGVGLDRADRERLRAITVELSALSTEFGSAVLEATDAWYEHVIDPALLVGISDTDLAIFAEAARVRALDGWVVTLQQPSVNAIMTFAENRSLRARVYEAYGTRASDRGPQGGQFDNSERIARILKLRREAAALLGFQDSVALSLATKMASTSEEILRFLRDLAERARPAAERELAELQNFASDTLGIEVLEPWDISFASNRLRRERFGLDEQEIRPYFPIDCVLAGWRSLLRRVFGIELISRDDVPLYSPDVRFYDVADEHGTIFAGIYVDLHARQGKRGGAWMARARPRLNMANFTRVPVAYLVCNFAPLGGDLPPLLSHRDIVTLLHETGHELHELCTEVSRPSVSGTSGFEWDAVELPSQLMEDFAWHRDVLTEMSGHYLTGETLPGELFDRMTAASRFQSGMFVSKQIELALFDLELHLASQNADPMKVLDSVRDSVAVIRPPEWHRFPHSFSHIFAGGYAAGYYSYLWAEVLAADAFQRFVEEGTINREVGELLRTEILSRGATRPARDSFRAFRGRDADLTAMLIRLGLQGDEAIHSEGPVQTSPEAAIA